MAIKINKLNVNTIQKNKLLLFVSDKNDKSMVIDYLHHNNDITNINIIGEYTYKYKNINPNIKFYNKIFDKIDTIYVKKEDDEKSITIFDLDVISFDEQLIKKYKLHELIYNCKKFNTTTIIKIDCDTYIEKSVINNCDYIYISSYCTSEKIYERYMSKYKIKTYELFKKLYDEIFKNNKNWIIINNNSFSNNINKYILYYNEGIDNDIITLSNI